MYIRVYSSYGWIAKLNFYTNIAYPSGIYMSYGIVDFFGKHLSILSSLSSAGWLESRDLDGLLPGLGHDLRPRRHHHPGHNPRRGRGRGLESGRGHGARGVDQLGPQSLRPDHLPLRLLRPVRHVGLHVWVPPNTGPEILCHKVTQSCPMVST